MSILKGALGGIGAGMGAMALFNEGKGETFTSYPKQSRYKQFQENAHRAERYAIHTPLLQKDSDGDIMSFAIKRYGKGDIGYSIGSLMVAADRDLIKSNMSVKEVKAIMEREGLSPYGFKLDESILNEVFNPFTKDLPQGDTMGTGDFG
tara:strand:+ start:40 stop:486 length:447 start_codon:yes stop_codon:yes gene_type:complete